jgi:hypothetical protein
VVPEFSAVPSHSSWTLLDVKISDRVVLFDSDLDGEPDQLAIDNYLYIEIPSPPLVTNAISYKVDFNATGTLCLVHYTAVDGFVAVTCPRLSYTRTTLVNATLRVYRWGLLLYNTTHRAVLMSGRLYIIPPDLEGVPLVVNGTPVIIGTRRGYVEYYNLETGESKRLRPLQISIMGATCSEQGLIFGVASTDSELLYFEYDGVNFKVRRVPITPPVRGVVTTTSRIYVLTSRGDLYYITSTSSESPIHVASGVEALYYPADSVNSFVALAKDRVLKIVETSSGVEIYDYSLPPVDLSEIRAVDWWGSVLAAATSRGVYVATTKPLYVVIKAPVSVYAGEPVRVDVSGVYESVVVAISGRVYRGFGNVSIYPVYLLPGITTVVARACRGVFCVENTTSIFVKPRPLEVRAYYPEKTRPYDPLTILVDTIDKLTNRSVVVSCNISDPYRRLFRSFYSRSSITVPALPDIDSSVFTISCGGREYEVVSVTVRSKLTEPYLRIKLTYYGNGLLEVSGYDKFTNRAWDGLVVVDYLDLDITVVEERRALVTLPLGSTRLRVSLVKNNITYYAEEFTVVYYEDVFKVPPGEEVRVADRIRVDVYTLTQTITRPVPVYYEIRVVDPLVIAATAAFTAGAVYAILMLLGKLPRLALRSRGA